MMKMTALMLLAPIVLIALLVRLFARVAQAEQEERVACPYCAEPILPEANKCRWCKSALP